VEQPKTSVDPPTDPVPIEARWYWTISKPRYHGPGWRASQSRLIFRQNSRCLGRNWSNGKLGISGTG